jgi:hypothetical protein
MLYLLFTLSILVFFGILIQRYKEIERPSEKVYSFKTRFTKNIWTSEQLDIALKSFSESWINQNPKDEKRLKKVLNQLNIIWEDKRWNLGPNVAIGEIVDTNTIKVWKGPLLNRTLPYSYKMIYTALPETLVQYVMYRLHGKTLTHQEILNSHKDILDGTRTKINGIVSKAKQTS